MATTIVSKGVVAFSTPARPEDTRCSPHANRKKGTTLATIATTKRCAHRARDLGIGMRRAATTTSSRLRPHHPADDDLRRRQALEADLDEQEAAAPDPPSAKVGANSPVPSCRGKGR